MEINIHVKHKQLLITISDFAYALNKKVQADIDIVDCSKPFNKVFDIIITCMDFETGKAGEAFT